MSDNEKIHIGDFHYPLPLLRDILGTVRTEPTSFAFDLLKMWEDSERKRIEVERTNDNNSFAEKIIKHEQQKIDGDVE